MASDFFYIGSLWLECKPAYSLSQCYGPFSSRLHGLLISSSAAHHVIRSVPITCQHTRLSCNNWCIHKISWIDPALLLDHSQMISKQYTLQFTNEILFDWIFFDQNQWHCGWTCHAHLFAWQHVHFGTKFCYTNARNWTKCWKGLALGYD